MKVLVTCPPMIVNLDEFRERFAERDIELHAPRIAQRLPEAELIDVVPSCHGWIIGDDPVTRAVLSAGRAGCLKAAVKWGVGVDNIDLDAAAELGIRVSNTPQMFGREVADLAMAYVTALARHVVEVDRGVRSGGWPKPPGISLQGRRVALVGYGDIGRQTARRLLAAEMRITVYDPALGAAPASPDVDLAAWPERLEEADFIVLTCSLTPDSYHLMDADALRRARRGVRVVNVARGALIDEAALVSALEDGHVSGAALDVFEEEPLPSHSRLRLFDQCIFGSHNASNTSEAVRRASARAIDLLFGLLNVT